VTNKTDWRESVPGLDSVYMFQGGLYCEDCGQAIQVEIRKDGKAPEDEDDEDSFDSDDFPKGPFGDGGGEADSPQHCDSQAHCLNAIKLPCGSKIGAWLGNPLTSDGINHLTNSILEDSLANRNTQHSLQVAHLWSYLYRDQLSERDSLLQLEDRALDAPIVKSFVKLVTEKHNHIINRVMIGLDNIYGFSSKKSAMWIWKSEFLPDGELGDPAYVQMPLGEAGERDPIEIVRELIEEGAWD
jgi:hypothetical protein